MISPTNQLPQHYVRETWKYRDGHLWWREPKSGRQLGKPAGSNDGKGYRHIGHHKKIYQAHVLIWNYHNGYVPQGFNIDHINRDRGDNRIENLRLADDYMQQINASLRNDSTSQVRGVSWNKSRKKWRADICVNKVTHCLGRFTDKQDAIEARRNAELKYWGSQA